MSVSCKKGPVVARVTFIRHQAMLEKEFREGWSALAIYERHKEELSTISYRQFLRYAAAWRAAPPAQPQPRQRRSVASPPPSTRKPVVEPPPEEDDEFQSTPPPTFRPSKLR